MIILGENIRSVLKLFGRIEFQQTDVRTYVEGFATSVTFICRPKIIK